jgi:DNA-nicking Smr family endonuclease
MDFGEILDQWEKLNAESRAKKPCSGSKPGPQKSPAVSPDFTKKTDPLSAWLRREGVVDKDAESEEAEKQEGPGERRRRLLRKRPDAVIDLHGLTQDEAWDALEDFFRESRQQGFEKVLVVHGKGNHSGGEAVLGRISRRFIESCPFAGENGHSSAPDGGAGATWVLLKAW